jgi:Glycosyl transferase family group 2
MYWYWWLLLVFFLRPAVEILVMVTGEWWFHTCFREDPGRFSRLIVQVTTVGRETDRVNEILAQLRGYALTMPHELWVVTEPGPGQHHPDADRVLTVPAEFTCQARYKARALEYSRRVREGEGLAREDVKILFLDDDTTPTENYVRTAYAADYDIAQGAVANRHRYATLPLRHFFLSHMDDMRLLGCFTYCALYQGILGRPLYVHGEGLAVTGAAEQSTTWDYPVYASEDLVFGHNAAARGHTWGYFHDYVENTSPWTVTAFVKQRRRWLWGNLTAIGDRQAMPLGSAALLLGNYLLGTLTWFASATAAVLLRTGFIENVPQPVYVACWASFGCWLGSFAVSGWLNSARPPTPDRSRAADVGWRVGQSLAAVVLAPVTGTFSVAVGLLCFYLGDPQDFEVIAKTEQTAKRELVPEDGSARESAAVAAGTR